MSGLSNISGSIFVNYASLLKLAQLWLRSQNSPGFRARERIALFQEYLSFIATELDTVSAYPLKLATDLLLGDPKHTQYVRRLLKFGRRILHDIWGAAWDLAQLNILEGVGTIIDTEGRPLAMVTADKGLIELRDYSAWVATLGVGRNDVRAIATSNYFDPRLKDHLQRLETMFEDLQTERLQRLMTRPGGMTEGSVLLEPIIERLEREVRVLLEGPGATTSGTPPKEASGSEAHTDPVPSPSPSRSLLPAQKQRTRRWWRRGSQG